MKSTKDGVRKVREKSLRTIPMDPNIRKLVKAFIVTPSHSKDNTKFHEVESHLTWCNPACQQASLCYNPVCRTGRIVILCETLKRHADFRGYRESEAIY